MIADVPVWRTLTLRRLVLWWYNGASAVSNDIMSFADSLLQRYRYYCKRTCMVATSACRDGRSPGKLHLTPLECVVWQPVLEVFAAGALPNASTPFATLSVFMSSTPSFITPQHLMGCAQRGSSLFSPASIVHKQVMP